MKDKNNSILISTQSSFPKGWVWTRMGEILSFEYGKSLREDKRDSNGTVPVYGSNGIVGYHSIALTDRACIIVGRKGAAGEVHISKVPCRPIDTTYYICLPDRVNLSFFYYLLSTLKLGSLDKSTAIPGLNRNDAYILTIPLPPLPEQHRIVAKVEELFTRLDAGVEALKKVKAELKRYCQSVLKYAFEGKLVPQDPSNEPAEKLLERIKAEKAKLESNKREKRRNSRRSAESL